jgi:glucose/arabinose dehydrogenase
MPAFPNLAPQEINALLAYVHAQKQSSNTKNPPGKNFLADPVPKKIALSKLGVELDQIVQIPPSSDSGKLPLTRITQFGYQPDGAGPFVLDLRGKLYRLKNNHPFVYFNLAAFEPKFIHQPGLATGFGSFAFHPQFAQNGLLYTTHSEPAGSSKADFAFPDSIKPALQWVLTEWKTDHPSAEMFSGKGRELLRIDMVSGIHGVQEIQFNPLALPGETDYGALYIGIGDGGAVENGFAFLAHSRSKAWGTILRIIPTGSNSRNGKYGIPESNPFVHSGDEQTVKEIYALGFRNPHRITWTAAGDMLVSNIGHSNIESVNRVLPGHDYGWPIREGNFLLDPYGDLSKIYPLPVNDSIYQVSYPVAEYDHDEGKAICGGYEYQGKAVPLLTGKYLFGDIPTGRLFYFELSDMNNSSPAPISEWRVSLHGHTQSLKELCGTDRVDLHFGRDNKGELYLLTKPDGKIYRVKNAVLK